jgi:hypothetical protein
MGELVNGSSFLMKEEGRGKKEEGRGGFFSWLQCLSLDVCRDVTFQSLLRDLLTFPKPQTNRRNLFFLLPSSFFLR